MNTIGIEYDKDCLERKATAALNADKCGYAKEYTVELGNGFYATTFSGEVSVWVYGTKEIMPGFFNQVIVHDFIIR